jgi:hypothetical protein
LAAFSAIAMNRVQVSQADTDGSQKATLPVESQTLVVAPTTVDPDVVAFG